MSSSHSSLTSSAGGASSLNLAALALHDDDPHNDSPLRDRESSRTLGRYSPPVPMGHDPHGAMMMLPPPPPSLSASSGSSSSSSGSSDVSGGGGSGGGLLRRRSGWGSVDTRRAYGDLSSMMMMGVEAPSLHRQHPQHHHRAVPHLAHQHHHHHRHAPRDYHTATSSMPMDVGADDDVDGGWGYFVDSR